MPNRKINKRGGDAVSFVRSAVSGTKFLVDTYTTVAKAIKIAKAIAPVA